MSPGLSRSSITSFPTWKVGAGSIPSQWVPWGTQARALTRGHGRRAWGLWGWFLFSSHLQVFLFVSPPRLSCLSLSLSPLHSSACSSWFQSVHTQMHMHAHNTCTPYTCVHDRCMHTQAQHMHACAHTPTHTHHAHLDMHTPIHTYTYA